MKERIIKIMEAENLTPSLFADKLNIGRAVISHILNGRNNPSLDVVIRILDTISYIDADWLLSGKGSMRKSNNMPQQESYSKHQTITTDLFDSKTQDAVCSAVDDVAKDVTITPTPTESTNGFNPTSSMLGASNKKISKVIIYYSDNTFQAFNPDNTPF